MHSVTFLSAAQVGNLLKLARDPFFFFFLPAYTVVTLNNTELGEPPVFDAAENFLILSLFEEAVITM